MNDLNVDKKGKFYHVPELDKDPTPKRVKEVNAEMKKRGFYEFSRALYLPNPVPVKKNKDTK